MRVTYLTEGKWSGRWAIVGSEGGIISLHPDLADASHTLRRMLGI